MHLMDIQIDVHTYNYIKHADLLYYYSIISNSLVNTILILFY